MARLTCSPFGRLLFLLATFSAGTIAYAAEFGASAWRGETAYVEIPQAFQDVASELSSNATGDDVSFILLRFDEVKYDTFERYTDKEGKKKARITGKGKAFDVCREWKKGDKSKPTMIKLTVSPDAKPGKRTVKLGEKGGIFTLTVVDRVLPPAKDWKYFLDLWQHPWAVSRFFNVKPFSKEHYSRMEPIWRGLAECGCKALTVTLLDLPWNNQCFDGYYSMIGRVKKADGKWEFDYTLFDEYVEFGRKCGLGPDIACYTMCPWGYMVSWKEEGTGNGEQGMVNRREKYLPGTPEFENYWGDFLVDFEKHLKAKGWFEDAYIAMDERAPEDVKKIIALIQKKAPGMKVAMAGNKSPSEFNGMTIDNYCQGLIHLRKHPKLLDELEPRRQKGFKTTFYVCATAMHPNTFMDSNLDEGFWLGAYPGAIGFDGFLRWAANSWPKNPYDDASFKTVRRGNLQWRPGDTFLIYPGGELSSRLIALRAGVVAAEKMWILKNGARGGEKRKEIEKSLKKLAAPYGYKGAIRNAFDFSAFRRAVEEFVNSQHVAFSLCAVGDSITQGGSNFVAYRIALENRFDKLGWDVKWMGSRSDASWGSKNPCEGYGGHNAESIASKYQVNAASITADVLLLHAGHNYNVGDARLTPAPMSESAIITAVTNAHARIIASARAQNPEVVVLYAKVITSGGNRGLKYSYIPNLNKAIGVLADELNTSKSPVISVDMAAEWNYAVDCVADCVHPNAVGAAKMADKWMAAISPLVDEGGLSVGSSGQ